MHIHADSRTFVDPAKSRASSSNHTNGGTKKKIPRNRSLNNENEHGHIALWQQCQHELYDYNNECQYSQEQRAETNNSRDKHTRHIIPIRRNYPIFKADSLALNSRAVASPSTVSSSLPRSPARFPVRH